MRRCDDGDDDDDDDDVFFFVDVTCIVERWDARRRRDGSR